MSDKSSSPPRAPPIPSHHHQDTNPPQSIPSPIYPHLTPSPSKRTHPHARHAQIRAINIPQTEPDNISSASSPRPAVNVRRRRSPGVRHGGRRGTDAEQRRRLKDARARDPFVRQDSSRGCSSFFPVASKSCNVKSGTDKTPILILILTAVLISLLQLCNLLATLRKQGPRLQRSRS